MLDASKSAIFHFATDFLSRRLVRKRIHSVPFLRVIAFLVCNVVSDAVGQNHPTVALSSAGWTNGHFKIGLSGALTYDHILQVSTDLTNWTSLSTNAPAAMPFFLVDASSGPADYRFYRALAAVRQAQTMVSIDPAAALALIQDHSSDSRFAILDVRTPAEYSARHIRGAVNLDFYSTAFRAELERLDKAQTYLVYCASGNRTRQAVEVMRQAGFLKVYSMLNGLGNFAALSGASSFLEP